MFPCRNKFFLFLSLAAAGHGLHAQTSQSGSNPLNGRDNNPYSKYGIGELLNGNNTALRAMGNVSSAFSSPFVINTDNPASYTGLDRTTFEVGGTGHTRATHGTVNGTEQTYRSGTATLAYMTLAFPTNKKNMGFCLGFKPYSHAYYSLRDSISAASTPPSAIDSAELIYNGEGALNYAYLGGAWRIKGLSIGINAGYIFGTAFTSTVLNPYDLSNPTSSFQSEYSTRSRTGGILWKGGLQYVAKIDSFHTLRIGGTFSASQKLKQFFEEFHISGRNFGDTIIRDTAYFTGELRGQLTMPMSWSGGIMYSRTDQWSVGIDYTTTQWSGFNSEHNTYMNNSIAASSYRLSLGGEYTPDFTDTRHLLSRTTYRLGGYTGTDYVMVKGYEIPYYGMTAGLSLPLKRFQSQVSYLHAAVDYGILGTTDNGLMRQNYLRFTLGLSMSAQWFVRPKLQ